MQSLLESKLGVGHTAIRLCRIFVVDYSKILNGTAGKSNVKIHFWQTKVKKNKTFSSMSCDRVCPCPLLTRQLDCHAPSSEGVFCLNACKWYLTHSLPKSNYRLPHGTHLTICINIITWYGINYCLASVDFKISKTKFAQSFKFVNIFLSSNFFI